MKTHRAFVVLAVLLLLSPWLGCKNQATEDTVEETYTVTYLGNGATSGTVPADAANYAAGAAVTVKGNTGNLMKTGYAFAGWNSLANGNGTTYIQGQKFAIGASDMSLYANWGTEAVWARTVSSGTGSSYFSNLALDGSGNVCAAGSQTGTDTYTYGGQTAAGSSIFSNAVLVKWDSSGTALWARSVATGSSDSEFLGTAVDGSGNVYAAGYQSGSGTFTYGGQSIAGTNSGGQNAVLVKYNSSGTALWAVTVTAGGSTSSFNSVALDGSGNLYAVGSQSGTGAYTYGSQSATGTASGQNIVLVKYNSSGTAIWARTVSAGSSHSLFQSVAVDGSGNVYAAGAQYGTGTYTYGGKDLTGTSTGSNILLVKYDSLGAVLWARTVAAGSSDSWLQAVAVDGSGNVYVSGYQMGTSLCTYGTQSVAGAYVGGINAMIVKYDSSGTALWARAAAAGAGSSLFNSLAADGSGNVYAAGYQNGNGTFTYGSQSAAGTNAGGQNAVLVRYDASGNALWARTVSAGSGNSLFGSLALDGSLTVYAAGKQTGVSAFTYGSQSATGSSSGTNAVLVKWRP